MEEYVIYIAKMPDLRTRRFTFTPVFTCESEDMMYLYYDLLTALKRNKNDMWFYYTEVKVPA